MEYAFLGRRTCRVLVCLCFRLVVPLAAPAAQQPAANSSRPTPTELDKPAHPPEQPLSASANPVRKTMAPAPVGPSTLLVSSSVASPNAAQLSSWTSVMLEAGKAFRAREFPEAEKLYA